MNSNPENMMTKKNPQQHQKPQTNKKHGSRNYGTKHVGKIFYLCKVKHKTIISVTVPNFNCFISTILAL